MNAHFEFLGPPQAGSLFELVPAGEDVVVGRASDCELVLPSTSVSRRHARLRWQGADLWVEDLGSANGTFVNGERLAAPRRLNDQDRVAFGPIELRFTSPPAESPPEPPTLLAEDPAATVVLPAKTGAPPAASAAVAGGDPPRGAKEPTPITMVLPPSAAERKIPELDSMRTADELPQAEPPPAAATMAVPRGDDPAPPAAATMAVPREDDPSPAATVAAPRTDDAGPSPPTTAFSRTEEPAAAIGATRAAPASSGPLPRAPARAARPASTAELAAIAVGSFLAVFGIGLAVAYWIR